MDRFVPAPLNRLRSAWTLRARSDRPAGSVEANLVALQIRLEGRERGFDDLGAGLRIDRLQGETDRPETAQVVRQFRLRHRAGNVDRLPRRRERQVQLAGIEGVDKITSSSRDESSRISIEFTLDREPDAAANDVRDRVSRAVRQLPEDSLHD